MPFESALRIDMDGSVAYFPISQETLPWQRNNVAKMLSTLTDTTCIRRTIAKKRIAISRSSCVHQQQISCENFVKFGPVTPELTELICERHVRHGQKNWRILSKIFGYTGPIFAVFSRYESALRADDGPVPDFPIC